MDFDATEQVNALAKLPPEPVKPEKRSAWNLVHTIPRAAVAESAAGAIEIGVMGARSLAQIRDATPEQRKQIDAEGVSGVSGKNDVSASLRNVAEDLRPDPATASKAEQIVFDLGRIVTKAIGYGVTLGPGAIPALAADEGLSEVDRLQRQGVDDATARDAGGVNAAATALGALIPVAGAGRGFTAANVGKVVGLAAASGPTTFMAQQKITSEILSRANYGDIAAQYDPLDLTGLALSIPAPLIFGGLHLRGGSKAPPKPAASRESGPVAADQAPAAPQGTEMPREAVDAAMVHNLTLQQDVHEAGLPSAASAHIPRAETLPPIDRAIEGRLAEKMAGDFEATVAEYDRHPDTMGGKVLNTDIARELSPDYLADRTRSAAVHEPASWFVKELYARKLQQIQPGDEIAFSSGGTGAGKTTAINQLGLVDDAAIVYDTNMNSLDSSVRKIEQALDAGAVVKILHVQRDAVEALREGALPRAMRQASEFGTGRTVPLIEHARTHRGAAEVIQQLAERYKDDPRVSITVIDNTRGKGNARLADLGFVRGFDYNGIEGRLHEALKQARDDGRISGDVFRATEGNAEFGPDAVRQPVVAGGRRQPEPQGFGTGQGRSGTPSGDELIKKLVSDATSDPYLRSVADRVAAVKTERPDAPVAIDAEGKRISTAEELDRARLEAAEGTDFELGTLDADLLRIAADCALSVGV